MTSIVLAVLAIVYAFYSNSSFAQNITSLNMVSQNISDTAKELSLTTKDLSQRVEAIPQRLESVEVKVDQANVILQQLSELQVAQPTSEQERIAVDKIVDLFITRMPPAGFLILYACALTYMRRLSFNLTALASRVDFLSDGYALGFLVSCNSAGLIDATVLDGNLTITSMNEMLRLFLTSRSEEYIQGIPNPRLYGEDVLEQARNSLREQMNTIEQTLGSLRPNAT